MNGLPSCTTRSIRRLRSFHYHAVSCALLLATVLLSGCDSGPLDATPELLAPQPSPGRIVVAEVQLEFDAATGIVRGNVHPTSPRAKILEVTQYFTRSQIMCDGRPGLKCNGRAGRHNVSVLLTNDVTGLPIGVTSFKRTVVDNCVVEFFFPLAGGFVVPDDVNGNGQFTVVISLMVTDPSKKFSIWFIVYGEVDPGPFFLRALPDGAGTLRVWHEDANRQPYLGERS